MTDDLTVGALISRYGKGTDSDATDAIVAAPLSHGSNPNSNMAGRRREDDENLVLGWTGERAAIGDPMLEAVIRDRAIAVADRASAASPPPSASAYKPSQMAGRTSGPTRGATRPSVTR